MLRRIFLDWRGDLRGVWVIALIIAAVLGIAAIVLGLVLAISYPVGHGICNTWGRDTGYRTKYVRLYVFDTGTCLAQTSSGQWVKNTNIIINTPERSKP